MFGGGGGGKKKKNLGNLSFYTSKKKIDGNIGLRILGAKSNFKPRGFCFFAT